MVGGWCFLCFKKSGGGRGWWGGWVVGGGAPGGGGGEKEVGALQKAATLVWCSMTVVVCNLCPWYSEK